MPIQTQVKKSIGPSGLAEVRPLKNGLRVIFNDGDQYEVTAEGWDRPAGRYQITLSQDLNKILFASPPQGTYLVKFAGFGNRQGKSETDPGLPEPYIKRGGPRKGKNGAAWFAPDELTVSAKLEVIQEGAYEGLNVVYTFPYAFEQYPGTPFTMIRANNTRLIRIEEFLRICGLDFVTDDIPFSANVLPWLEDKFVDAGKVFSVSLNDKGFIDTLTEIPQFLIPENMVKKSSGAKKNGKAKERPARAMRSEK